MPHESRARPSQPEPVASFAHKAGTLHTLFLIGVIAKGVDGLLEVFGGLLQSRFSRSRRR
jgi:hypothetical protein